MRLVTVRVGDEMSTGRVEGTRVTRVGAPDVGALITAPGWRDGEIAGDRDLGELEDLDLAPVEAAFGDRGLHHDERRDRAQLANTDLAVAPGKTFDRTTPIAPNLTTCDEIEVGDLVVRCEVDGEVVQEGRTSDLLFKPAEIVAYLSQIMTLAPGDLVSTGTPGGVGISRNPPVFLRPGQTLRTSIEGLGELVNPCISARLSCDQAPVNEWSSESR